MTWGRGRERVIGKRKKEREGGREGEAEKGLNKKHVCVHVSSSNTIAGLI